MPDAAPEPGIFLALEGIEGSGKSTQTELLAGWLAELGLDHVVTREPGGTDVGERVREVLLETEHVPARTELLLIVAARAALTDELVRPALERGAVVVTDRWALSTLAYQGHARALPLDEVRRINAFATAGLEPSLTILLQVPLQLGVARLAERGRVADRFERAGRGFHERVAAAYDDLATEERVAAVDGTGSPEEVHERIRAVLTERFPETFVRRVG